MLKRKGVGWGLVCGAVIILIKGGGGIGLGPGWLLVGLVLLTVGAALILWPRPKP
jgi:hypothetical protein